MIQWKKFDKNNPPIEGKYLLFTTNGNITGNYKNDKMLGYTWWDDNKNIIWGVTHYIESNESAKRSVGRIINLFFRGNWKMSISKEEFELTWRTSAGYSQDRYNEERATVPCDCDYENCHGWAAIPKSELEWDKKMGFRKE